MSDIFRWYCFDLFWTEAKLISGLHFLFFAFKILSVKIFYCFSTCKHFIASYPDFFLLLLLTATTLFTHWWQGKSISVCCIANWFFAPNVTVLPYQTFSDDIDFDLFWTEAMLISGLHFLFMSKSFRQRYIYCFSTCKHFIASDPDFLLLLHHRIVYLLRRKFLEKQNTENYRTKPHSLQPRLLTTPQ